MCGQSCTIYLAGSRAEGNTQGEAKRNRYISPQGGGTSQSYCNSSPPIIELVFVEQTFYRTSVLSFKIVKILCGGSFYGIMEVTHVQL